MKEKGVTACILHFNVLNTRSSILCMVLASNTNFDSLTCLEILKSLGDLTSNQIKQKIK